MRGEVLFFPPSACRRTNPELNSAPSNGPAMSDCAAPQRRKWPAPSLVQYWWVWAVLYAWTLFCAHEFGLLVAWAGWIGGLL